ncbi:MAG: hypothetical protein HQK91_02330 [Nitrospirae bacterium]|nr:hypothetical protein [Nitrospirota bacterium]MBF0540271.1 hypothetical protein [Nitrospirota bacterium]
MMNIKKKLKEFNKRFDIVDDTSYELKFKKFKTRVLIIFSGIDVHVTHKGIKQFCKIVGISDEWSYGVTGPIINKLSNENNEKEFYRLLEIIFIPLYEYSNYIHYYNELLEVIELSEINLRMTMNNGKVIFSPRGEEKLDEVLVDEAFSFLNPESSKHFLDALDFYSKTNAIKSAESLRRSLEEFLHFKLNNSKGLNANIVELQNKLKSDKRDPQILKIIFYTFNHFDQYFNDNSKHNDGDITESENEFLVYQTALLMRYIHKVIT